MISKSSVAFAAAFAVSAVAMVAITLSSEPRKTCDMTALARGDSVEQVRGLCGEPRSASRTRYPFMNKDDLQWCYGSALSSGGCLYFDSGKLRSVQIFD